jgi:hypothetical protein
MFLTPLFLVSTALVSATSSWAAQFEEATASTFAAQASAKGVVLVDVYWDRAWKCGRYENAQLMSLGFDRSPLNESDTASASAFTLENPSTLAPPTHFVPYAFLVEPGQYDMTSFTVKFASSLSTVERNEGTRKTLVKDGVSRAGSFTVAPGEVVYIGNFAVDCYGEPIPWRYFTEKRADFDKHLEQYRRKYPFLVPTKVVYRLFATEVMGRTNELK